MLKPFLAGAVGLSLLFSSCQKDVIKEEDSLSAVISSDANASDAIVETTPANYNSVATYVNSNCAGFWQGIPTLYSKTTKKYPLIIFLHGIGELGTNLGKMNCCGLPYYLSRKTFPANFKVNNVNHSYIVMAPQFKVRATPADVQAAIDYMKARYRIDASRIYVTGLSLGGGSTWDYAGVYGQNAAAIVPVCGGTSASTTLSQKIATKNLPIWGFYSSQDAVVPSSWGYNFFKWIDQYNTAYASATKLTMWSSGDHNSVWLKAYNPATRVDGYNLYEWMLLYTRSGTSSVPPTVPTAPTTPTAPTSGNVAPVAKAGADQTIPASWNWFPTLNATLSTDTDGWIAKFTWSQVSGPKNVSFVSPGSGSTKVTGWISGTYVFRIAVTDNKGAISYDDVSITISGTATTSSTSTSTSTTPTSTNPVSGNIAPVANAGIDQSIPKSWNWFPSINGTLSKDSDGWLAKYAWSQVSGPNTATLTTTSVGISKLSGLIVGTYTFRIAVTDNKNAVSYDDVKITVTNN